MKVVLALGNPGPRYAATRHNIGWMVADALAAQLRKDFVPGRGEYYEVRCDISGTSTLIAKPTTWMNNSGIAAVEIREKFGVRPEDMLVIVDELQFPVGRIQLKSSGSSGGHNGTASIIAALGTSAVPRLRCGVGGDFGDGEMVDYVLAAFPEQELGTVQEMVVGACDAVRMWIRVGTTRAMNIINSRPASQHDAPSDAAPARAGGEETGHPGDRGEHAGDAPDPSTA